MIKEHADLNLAKLMLRNRYIEEDLERAAAELYAKGFITPCTMWEKGLIAVVNGGHENCVSVLKDDPDNFVHVTVPEGWR